MTGKAPVATPIEETAPTPQAETVDQSQAVVDLEPQESLKLHSTRKKKQERECPDALNCNINLACSMWRKQRFYLRQSRQHSLKMTEFLQSQLLTPKTRLYSTNYA